MDSSLLNRSLYSSIANQKRGPRKSDGPQPAPSTGLGKKVGGWVFGKWGATPAPVTPESPRPASSNSQSTQGTATGSTSDSIKKKDKDKASERPQVKLRPSGVNQNGPIWGFFDIPEVPTKVVVQDYDAEALGDALGEIQQ
jgi:hypothetical protein